MDYLVAAGSIVLAWIILTVARRRIILLLKKLTARTTTDLDDLFINATEKFVIPYLYLTLNYSIITQLTLSPKLARILAAAVVVVTTYYAVRLVTFLLHGVVLLYMHRKNEPPERIRQLSGMLLVIKAFAWTIGIIMLIDNLGYDVTTIIAGLGVGGIAIALAAQNILGDLFSYFVIFFDKPFEVGDFIIVGANSGTVEKIGIKTSHVRSLDGQQLIMPNAEIVKSVIQNYKRLERRRVVFTLGVVYYTASEKLRKIPGIIRETIVAHELTTFDRAHFKNFGEFSIVYETVYYIESADYLVFMDTHHSVSLTIFEKFEREHIQFAFPTQTLFLKDGGLPDEPGGDEP